jgi:hypothetical protein
MTVFEGRTLAGEMHPADDETADIAYFSQDEIATVKVQPWVNVVLPDMFRRAKEGLFAPARWAPMKES